MSARHRWFGWFAILPMLALTACEGKSFAADERGEGAIHIANLWWIMLIISAVIYVEVLVLLGLALFRSRNRQTTETPTPITKPPSNRVQLYRHQRHCHPLTSPELTSISVAITKWTRCSVSLQ